MSLSASWLPFFSSSSISLVIEEGLDPAFFMASNKASLVDRGFSLYLGASSQSWAWFPVTKILKSGWFSAIFVPISSYNWFFANYSNWVFQSEVPTFEVLSTLYPGLLKRVSLYSEIPFVTGLLWSTAWEMSLFFEKLDSPMLIFMLLSAFVFLSMLS